MEREAKQKEEAEGAARDQFPPPPPPMTQQNFIQYMQLVEERQRVTLEQQNKFFQDLLQQNRVERPENPGVTLADFQNTKPISFAYAPEPMDAEDWLMDTERKLNTVGCNDQEKVRYATHLLCGPAASWWDNIVAVYPAGKVFTWEEFTRKFRESNVPESIVELKRREFESLEQKDKAILTYVREFSKLSRYAVEEVNTEDKKKKRFLRGLSPQFKVQLRMMRATEFQELVDAAITLEDDFKQLQEEKRKKAKFEPKRYVSNKPNTGLSFKPRYNNNNNNNSYNNRRNQGNQAANQIVCRICGFRGHLSQDCRKPKIICFGCRQEGHMLKDCPKKNSGGGQSGGGGGRGGNTGGNWKNKKPFGKLNCTSLEEVVNSDQAVIGVEVLPPSEGLEPGYVAVSLVPIPASGYRPSSAGVFIRTGLTITTGERVASGLIWRFGSLDCVSDNAGCFADRPFPAGGSVISFGGHDVYVATVHRRATRGRCCAAQALLREPAAALPPAPPSCKS
ncbi:hypothetical protein QYE76_043357 [Lolium multiflorum]|uniref:CCHC-type domain-containing protein n=1 Tax=Lolium multiflorum TaxID=4521 RepID=A0AAD8TGZ4_LOLMU|nr:hypothetical protein QYE76_043357 [Lolium multiflorum]